MNNKVKIVIGIFNVNSINMRVDHVEQILKKHNVDFLLLQELKCEQHNIPEKIKNLNEYKFFGNHQKSYNGVSIIISKKILNMIHLDEIEINNYFSIDLSSEARYIEVRLKILNKKFLIGSIYTPNGNSVDSEKFNYKIYFLEKFKNYIGYLNKNDDYNIVIGGDFNIAPYENDLSDYQNYLNSIGFSYKERKIIREIFGLGFYDIYRLLNKKNIEYSWFDYRNFSFEKNHGMRIDYMIINSKLTKFLSNCFFDNSFRSKEMRPSDHIPFFSEFII
jgi:exodeoxyribonuclease-3